MIASDPCWDAQGKNSRVDLLAVSVEANADGGSTVSSALTRSHTDNMSVDSARDAVVKLDVELGQSVFYLASTMARISSPTLRMDIMRQ